MVKAELRKKYLQKRKGISEAERAQLNYQICEKFFTHVNLSFIKVVHSFLPIPKNAEPDTWLIIDRIRREFPHIRLSIPRINTKSNMLENFFFEGLHQLEENYLGIQQPRQGVPTEAQKIDLIIVPLLAFDRQGHRVGYGKGFYDKFLATCKADAQKIGVSFFGPEDKIDDVNATDFKLTACICPDKFYAF